ncbi:hypothetical protein ACSFA0_24740 [Variovorax sp. LT1P1]|uniref:hypothetical protein n=1 Tax=Variovorax sp. LT1P1 TaxID=3443730 RepID=UPI003F45D19F
MDRLLFKVFCFIWSFSRANFYRDLADALTRKVILRDFLERAASNARILDDSTSVRVYRAMSARLAAGRGATFSELVANIAPKSDQLLMRAVDDAVNDQSKALMMAADAVEFQQRSMRAVAFELVVPVLAIPIVGALTFITSQIVNGIADGGAPAEVWSGFNGLVRWLAAAVTEYAVVIAIAIVALVAVTVYALPRWTGPMRLKAEGLPVVSLFRDYNSAVVLSSLAMLIQAGKTLREALQSLSVSSQPWLRWHLLRIVTALEDNPTDYMAAFGRGLMPPAVRARLASLMDSKKFDEALIQLGTSEMSSLERRVRLSAGALKWSLTLASLVIAVVLSIGTMTIASALAKASDPTTRMLHRAQQAP